jgi:DNA-binding Lrp family transcriptional regulator
MDATDRALVERLQTGIPLCPRPYREIGEACGLSEEEVIARIGRLCEEGVIRRLGARVAHLRAGIHGNVMVVWRVPEERVEEVGQALAREPAISHCYEREPQADFPYNLYTMVHAADLAAAEALVERLGRAVGVSDFVMLPTVRELKKTSPRYRLSPEGPDTSCACGALVFGPSRGDG